MAINVPYPITTLQIYMRDVSTEDMKRNYSSIISVMSLPQIHSPAYPGSFPVSFELHPGPKTASSGIHRPLIQKHTGCIL